MCVRAVEKCFGPSHSFMRPSGALLAAVAYAALQWCAKHWGSLKPVSLELYGCGRDVWIFCECVQLKMFRTTSLTLEPVRSDLARGFICGVAVVCRTVGNPWARDMVSVRVVVVGVGFVVCACSRKMLRATSLIHEPVRGTWQQLHMRRHPGVPNNRKTLGPCHWSCTVGGREFWFSCECVQLKMFRTTSLPLVPVRSDLCRGFICGVAVVCHTIGSP